MYYDDYGSRPTSSYAEYARAEAAEHEDRILAVVLGVGLFAVLIFASLFVGCL